MPRQPDAASGIAGPLRRLQRDLQNHLIDEDDAIAEAIVDAPPLPTLKRLGIYRNAYRVRLIEALDDTYPILHAVLGDEDFAALGEQFVAAHPSVHRSIRWYGGEFADFLERWPPYDEQPIFAELALLEWTLAEVFDAADAEAQPRAALSAIDASAWSGLTFDFHPSVRRLQLQWNTAAVWQAMSRGEDPPGPACADQPVPWLLWRQDLQNYFRSMAADESAALDSALRGDTFGEICESLIDWLPEEEIPLRAASLLATWADSGIIVGISRSRDD
jgi:hypothetical protein